VRRRESFFRIVKDPGNIYRTGPLASFSAVAWRDHPFVQPATERDQLNVLANIQRAQARRSYLEISFWPIPFSAGRALELLAHKIMGEQ
jgi:hypothetical protein